MDATDGPRVEVAGTTPGPSSDPYVPTVLRLRGDLDAAGDDGADVTTASLAAMLLRHGHVVADVTDLAPGRAGSVLAFTAALDRVGSWPVVSLVLAAPRGPLAAALAGFGIARRVPVHADLATAVARAAERPVDVRASWSFTADPHAPGRARAALRQVCRAWSVDDDALEAAEIVITELVTNAVEHASSGSVVEVARVGDVLRTSVRDFDPRALPAVAVPAPDSARGRGLAMVVAVSQAWGVLAHGDGKTIWSEIPVR